MERIATQLVDFLKQGLDAIFAFLSLVWTWSFGQIIEIFRSDWQALPFWKLVVLGVVVVVIAYVAFKAANVMWNAAVAMLRSFVAMLSAFVVVLPYVAAAGAIAFVGGYLIDNIQLQDFAFDAAQPRVAAN